jgi:hypothetical protein
VPRERDYTFHHNILQLAVGGRRKPPARQLSWLQTREGGDAGKEVTKNTQDCYGKVVLFQTHHAASDTLGVSGRSLHSGIQGPCSLAPTRTTDNRSVISGSECKQFDSEQNIESSSNGSTAEYDIV